MHQSLEVLHTQAAARAVTKHNSSVLTSFRLEAMSILCTTSILHGLAQMHVMTISDQLYFSCSVIRHAALGLLRVLSIGSVPS